MSKFRVYLQVCLVFSTCLLLSLPLVGESPAAAVPELLKFNRFPSPSENRIASERLIVANAERETTDHKNKPKTEASSPLKADSAVVPGAGPENKQDENEQDIMDSALELLNSSQDYWVRGDIESALEMLDQAYALLLDADGDPDIARQKDDLRLLISKRILALYSSRQTVTNGKRSEVQLVMNADVEKEIRSFQNGERDFFIQSYQRAASYRPIILKALKAAGLPEELSWLPLVESGFKILALSRARALGLWQFIPSTGYKYGLNRDDWVDERMDVEKSTQAAIGYLKDLHEMFGDWLTVLAAYNCGEGRVLRVISRQHLNYLDRFWDLYRQLPNETARYVPRFLATLHIIRDPKKYGMTLVSEESNERQFVYSYEKVKTTKSMRLQDISARLDTSEDIMNILNAELRYRITPDREYTLKIPVDLTAKFAALVDDIPTAEKPGAMFVRPRRAVFLTHRVKRGETYASIAQRYRTTVKSLASANRRARGKGLRAGQSLKIPMEARFASDTKRKQVKKTARSSMVKYKVKKGDTLSSLAGRFNVSVNEIRETNNLKESTIRPGQSIRIDQSDSQDSEKTVKQVTERKGKSKKKTP